ncbi:response regulator transcription factor [Roseimaritima ulvae]|uniref:Alkaline phosphatase synthesis transcriptional regulatory protein PhoP n=1 Tax=Roseimaritima ulvae TaxID=980254 RepID=A0A5B9QZS1_9BACT|nr:response regulator transcription factor [Roseimaritima ulvae]QEG39501.1 Alkaline phosphatase synthesis transcriptional regulatory protein PhoP [Roseimaritima ulvae]
MKLKILIAEDDPHTRAALSELLRGEGHDVIAAGSGEDACRLFDQQRPDLACLDVMMPGRSGYDVCRHIRAAAAHTPILFITARAEEIDKVVGLELGADDYIVKPFGGKEVLARIRAVARRCLAPPQPPRSDEPEFADEDFWMHQLHVIPRQLRAQTGDQSIELTPRELQILQLLHARADEVVDRKLLFEIIWGATSMPASRTLDQTISQLRKRIEPDPKHPQIIQTVYGVGYRYCTAPS